MSDIILYEDHFYYFFSLDCSGVRFQYETARRAICYICKDFLFLFVILFSPLYIDASILVCAITPSQNKQTAKCKKKREDKKKKMNGLYIF